MSGVAFLQSVGDVVVMPGGWLHFVYNLTPTVAFGGSHLRLEGLSMLEKYINDRKYTVKDLQMSISGMGLIEVIAKVLDNGVGTGAADHRLIERATRIAVRMAAIMAQQIQQIQT